MRLSWRRWIAWYRLDRAVLSRRGEAIDVGCEVDGCDAVATEVVWTMIGTVGTLGPEKRAVCALHRAAIESWEAMRGR